MRFLSLAPPPFCQTRVAWIALLLLGRDQCGLLSFRFLTSDPLEARAEFVRNVGCHWPKDSDLVEFPAKLARASDGYSEPMAQAFAARIKIRAVGLRPIAKDAECVALAFSR